MTFRSRVTALSAGQVGTVWAAAVVFFVIAVWQHGAVAESAERFAGLPDRYVLTKEEELQAARSEMLASKEVADDNWRRLRDLFVNSGKSSPILEEQAKNATSQYKLDSTFVAHAERRLREAQDAHNRSVEQRAHLAEYLQLGLTTLVILTFALALAVTWTWFGARKVFLERQ